MTDINITRPENTGFKTIQEWLSGAEHSQVEILSILRTIPDNEYESVRNEAAEKLSWRVSVLDNHRRTTTSEANSNDLFHEPDAWQEPVNGQDLLNDIKAVFQRHVVFTDEAATACSLWILHTYAFDATYISPILAITSPEKRCGKSTLLGILNALAYRPLTSGSITAASMFRIIERFRPTLLVDEADTYLSTNDHLRGVINSGHTKSTARVVRCVGDNHEPKTLSTWAPKAIACIGELPDTISDRSIEIKMQRKTQSDLVMRFRERNHIELRPIQSKILRWVQDNIEMFKEIEPKTVDCLGDRAADSWEPLLAIADQIGGEWPDETRRAAKELSCIETQLSMQSQLLADLKNIFTSITNTDKIQSLELVNRLIKLEESPWESYSHGRGLTARSMATILKNYGIHSRDIRFPEGTKKGYYLKDFHDAFTRYLPPENATSATGMDNKGLEGDKNATYGNGVADRNPIKH